MIQRFVDIKNILVVAADDEVFDDYIKLAAVGEGHPHGVKQVIGFFQIEPKANGEGNCRHLAWLVILVALVIMFVGKDYFINIMEAVIYPATDTVYTAERAEKALEKYTKICYN